MLKRIVAVVGIPTHVVACHLFGDHHSQGHRMLTGVLVMSSGVFIAHSGAHFGIYFFQAVFDCLGYGVHALGATPFIERILTWIKTEEQDADTH